MTQAQGSTGNLPFHLLICTTPHHIIITIGRLPTFYLHLPCFASNLISTITKPNRGLNHYTLFFPMRWGLQKVYKKYTVMSPIKSAKREGGLFK